MSSYKSRTRRVAPSSFHAVGINVLMMLLLSGLALSAVRAQESASLKGSVEGVGQSLGDSAGKSPTIHLAKYRQYPWNGFSVWAGGSYETRTASHNEHFSGSMRVIGVQISRDIWRGAHSKISYLGEVLPVMLVRSGPPVNRIPDTLARIVFPQQELDRFKFRQGYGFGLAPFGAEVMRQVSTRTSVLFNVTAGGLLFTQVVPYGAATKANFTVSPGVAFQWELQNRTRVAIGYNFHHLSNASFGTVNPGMNSQIIYVRMSRLRPVKPTPE